MKRFWGRIEQVTLGTSGRTQGRLLVSCGVLVAVMLLGARHADAVPSFARQTGLACSACHTTFPELTAFGRMFKLHGYTLQAMKELEEPGTDEAPAMTINRAFPLSIMLQTSLTRTDRLQPGTQNNNVEFPQALSLFLAGEITPHIGTFLQATYSGQDDHFTLDNTDIRYANDTNLADRELLYGIDVNNNPTVEDPWHTTPAWGFPFALADSAQTPAAAALVDGGLAQQVAGGGLYALFDKHLYANVAVYRSAHIGEPQPPTNGLTATGTIKDVAPYWRLAWQQSWGRNYLEVGTFGLWAQVVPNTLPNQPQACPVSGGSDFCNPVSVSGEADRFSDYAFDTQFERPFGKDFVSAHATYIFENAELDAMQPAGGASNLNDKLHTFRLDGIYHWRDRLSLALGWFLIRGQNDALRYGSANGSPDSDGLRADIGFFPWQNIRLSAQYTAYTEFNGRTHNFDGNGRDSWNNNTLYLLAWLMY
ncbi:MAG TPA: cytochrome C [Candidatus Binatia bacterium]